ncbi:MAG: dipeptide epimerase [Methanobacteriota archaeon]
MELEAASFGLTLKKTFRISRGAVEEVPVLHIRLTEAGSGKRAAGTGRGEGAAGSAPGSRLPAPGSREASETAYGEASPAKAVTGEGLTMSRTFLRTVLWRLETLDPAEGRHLLEGLHEEEGRRKPAARRPAALAALEMALLDLEARARRVPVHRLLGVRPEARPTSTTVSLGTPSAMAAEAAAYVAEGFRALKVKLGAASGDDERIRAVRAAAPGVRLRVDANQAWSARRAVGILPLLARLEVELIEQPVRAADLRGLGDVTRATDIPVFADEAVLRHEDVERVASSCSGINVKLMKCGGLLEALRMMKAARERDLRVMLGCNIESSLSITAASHLAGLADFVDLDGAYLTSNDPFVGARIEKGEIQPPEDAGLGVSPRPGTDWEWKSLYPRGAARRG